MMTHAQSSRGAAEWGTASRQYSTRPLGEGGLLISDQAAPLIRAWRCLIDKLLAIRILDDDWDGQGAEAPHPSIVDGSINLARLFLSEKVTPADRVIAGMNGTIIFEWYSPEDYCEIEVVSPNEAEVRQVRNGSDVADESRFYW